MKPTSSSTVISITSVAAAIATGAGPSAAAETETLLKRIRSRDDQVRCEAWQNAGTVGAPAVGPLAALLVDTDIEVARSAKRAMEKIVHRAGRPGAAAEASAVEAELIKLLKHESPVIRRAAVWMLSEIGSDESVEPISALLADAQVREDARCALQRIPGDKSVNALKTAMKAVPEEFTYAIADSLRKRGQNVPDYPTKKLAPTLSTQVKAAPAPNR
ncbi:MAG: HEAT repeat domain-containing protein [Planctomycetota bacterium]|nr:HEAT repeat domain-containing protein [Planctomycetota bacterium]